MALSCVTNGVDSNLRVSLVAITAAISAKRYSFASLFSIPRLCSFAAARIFTLRARTIPGLVILGDRRDYRTIAAASTSHEKHH